MRKHRLLLMLCSMLAAACASLTSSGTGKEGAIRFQDISDDVGLQSEASWKYGGPSVADFSNDGIYDFVVSNHDQHPMALWYGTEAGSVRPHQESILGGDVHGAAPGDYDNDGDVDLIVSVGGGNGKTPRPPRLMRNDNGEFVNVTETSGIAGLGARGRAVRWIDMDLDGDLDLLHIVARQLPGETGPRNTVFENIGNGKFQFRKSPGVQEAEAERLLVTDFNNDNRPDLILFEPLSIWQGDGLFVFKNVTEQVLPDGFDKAEFVTAAADADFDNDGDRDLYLARGKTYYQTANNSVDFDEKENRLDIRDAGNESHDGISFTAADNIELSRFWHWRRVKGVVLPVYLGAGKTRIDTPTSATVITPQMAKGFPEKISENGWHLGWLGGENWRLEWRLNGNLAWGVRATVKGVDAIAPDWTPHDYNNAPDVLLENIDGRFFDVSERLPRETRDSNWGVTHGDFDNDGFEDFFVYRFGKLNKRVPDLLLRNTSGKGFELSITHGAFVSSTEAHGDMGAAFDYDLDGRIDMLNGDDDQGRWHLYKNTSDRSRTRNYLLVHVGYSENFTDPLGAIVTVESTGGLRQMKDVGSAGAVHSQSLMSILHFGVGMERTLDVNIRWRDGTNQVFKGVKANQVLDVGYQPDTRREQGLAQLQSDTCCVIRPPSATNADMPTEQQRHMSKADLQLSNAKQEKKIVQD